MRATRSVLRPRLSGSLLLSCSLLLLSITWGCNDKSDPTDSDSNVPSEKHERIAPGECSLSLDEPPDCAPNDVGLGGAGGMATSSCLLDQVATLSCPSYVSSLEVTRGAQWELDILVGLQGQDGRNGSQLLLDENLYVSALRLTEEGEVIRGQTQTYHQDAFPLQILTPAIGGTDTRKVLVSSETEGRLQVTDPFDPQSAPLELVFDGARVTQLVSDADHGHLALGLIAEDQTPVIVSDVLGEKQVFQLTEEVSALAVTPHASGQTFALSLAAESLSLVLAESKDTPLWSSPLSAVPFASTPQVDILSLSSEEEESAYVLYPEGSDYRIRVLSKKAGEASFAATEPLSFATHSSTCDAWIVGIVCNRCQTDQNCGTIDDTIRQARLMRGNGKFYVVYVAERHEVQKQVQLSTSDIFGLGCFCQAKEVATVEPSLVLAIKELVSGEDETLTFVERGTWNLGSPDISHVSLSRANSDQVDVVLGAPLQPLNVAVSDFPVEPVIHRIYHVSGK